MTVFPLHVIRTFRKIYMKNMIRAVLPARIIKTLKILRKVHNLSMVHREVIYIGLAASCFAITGFFAINLHASPSHGMVLSPSFPILLAGLAAHKPVRDEENNGESKKDEKNTTNSTKSTKRKGTKKDIILELLYPAIDWIEVLAKTGITVVAYVRVSTLKQAVEGESLKAQENELRAMAKRMGAARIIWLIDAGKSGRDFSGRKLSTILALAAAGKVDKLIVSEIDRVGRKVSQPTRFSFTTERLWCSNCDSQWRA